MGDLYTSSMACSTSLHHRSSLGWDLHNLGVFNADMSLVMDNSTAPFFSCLDSDPSTGYLQDALVEFSDRSKRRRLLLYTDHETNSPNDLMKTYWNMNPNCTWDLSENFNCMNQIASIGGVSAEPINGSAMSGMISEEEPTFADMKTPEETVSALEALDSSSSSYKEYSVNTKSVSEKDTLCSIDPLPPSTGGDHKKKKKLITRVVYPFAVVKPGGLDGDMTLNDINERILMPPTRPVRHPVGDFASRPFVSPDGPGLSGKAVVALTRIHTQGRGTITIIRTKG
ncbi:hypothetical protein VitviT2T_000549 [Vitis vinifera]|uniref:Protein XRI1 n=2 Tax=Vitis vinifera TaxID=29760 RepID=A0ABY9BDI6_VITVI|eukprot:XP_002281819.1 PREDICTED: protein XRI1 isoform X1 [Vitis vinifera]